MKIVFWGESRQCGTTSNMHAVAGMLSVMRPGARIEVGTLGGGQRSGRPDVGESRSLRREATNLEEASGYGKEEPCYLFLDCGSGRDKRRREVLRQADLVVVNLTQEAEVLREFFLYDIHLAPNFLILLGKYYELSRYGRNYLEHFYRIAPESVGVVPCNPELKLAADRGKVRRFIQNEAEAAGNVRNKELLRELTHVTELLLQKTNQYTNKNSLGGFYIWNR